MIKLLIEKKWTGDGFGQNPRLMKQIKRSEKNAVYEVFESDTQKSVGFEVFQIKILKKGTQVYGSIAEDDTELYPASGSFGKTAWSCSCESRALERFNALESEKTKEDESQTEYEMVQSSAPVGPMEKQGRGRRRKTDGPVFVIPDGEFSCKELAKKYNIDYATANSWLQEQLKNGSVKFVRDERRALKGKPTKLYSKSDFVPNASNDTIQPPVFVSVKKESTFIIPDGEFSCKELAEKLNTNYIYANNFIKEQLEKGTMKFVRDERRASRGKPTRIYSKAD